MDQTAGKRKQPGKNTKAQEAKARAEAAEQERKERKEWCAKIKAKMAERNMERLLRRAELNMVRQMTDKERLVRRVIGESTSWADILQNFLPPRQCDMLRHPHLCAQCRRNILNLEMAQGLQRTGHRTCRFDQTGLRRW